LLVDWSLGDLEVDEVLAAGLDHDQVEGSVGHLNSPGDVLLNEVELSPDLGVVHTADDVDEDALQGV